MVDSDYGNLKSKVSFVWGTTCTFCVLFVYFLVPETKGLSLEQVDMMLEETTPRNSAKWSPHATFTGGPMKSDVDSMNKPASMNGVEHHDHAWCRCLQPAKVLRWPSSCFMGRWCSVSGGFLSLDC